MTLRLAISDSYRTQSAARSDAGRARQYSEASILRMHPPSRVGEAVFLAQLDGHTCCCLPS